MKHEIPRWVNSAYDRRRSEQAAEIVKPGIEEAAYDAQDFGMFWILASPSKRKPHAPPHKAALTINSTMSSL